MTPAQALAELHAAGVRVRLDGTGAVVLHARLRPPDAVLALARAHRDGIGAVLRGEADMPAPPPTPLHVLAGEAVEQGFPELHACARACISQQSLPGVPLDWCEGVGLLATVPAPPTILSRRWAALAASAFRLVRDHGAELHTAGWDALDLFGLHSIAPLANPTGWGLAWLLGVAGEVLDVAPEAVGMRHGPGGARMVFHQRRARERSGISLAWNVHGNPG